MKNAYWIQPPTMKTMPCFKKQVKLKEKVKKATLKITAMGFYKAYINEVSVTDNVFMPGWTSYLNRVQYQKYDVTKLIDNDFTLDILLGEGWGGSTGLGWQDGKYPYFHPSLIFKLEITYVDGSKEVIVSDDTLDVYTSHILYSSIYNGEVQDETLPITYVGKACKTNIDSKIVKQQGEDIVEGEHIYPRSMFKTPKGELVIDFGQNFAGYININIKGNKGEKISYIPAEVLDKYGNFYNENYRAAKSYFSFTLTGNEDNFKPLFTFLGGRYIKLLEYPENISLSNFKGILVHSKMKKTGHFICGNQKINQLYHNVVYGQLSNYIDVPTDCPQRDERLGWLGDAQVFCRTASINFDTHKFFSKWLTDMKLDQHEDGGVEGVAPIVPGCYIPVASGWGDASVVCPWEIYLAYNDKKILKDNFSMMKKWLKYVLTQCEKPYIFEREPQYGDWLALDAPYGSYVGSTALGLIGTAFLAYSTSIIIKAGKIINEDVSEFEKLYVEIKKAYQNEFLENGLPKGHIAKLNSNLPKTPYTQTGIALTLHFNLCEEEDRAKLVDALVDLIKESGYRMTTGFLGTPYILHALSDNGRADIAYELLFQEKNPSWLYSINLGATTMWEHYDGINEEGDFWSKDMNSFNHYGYGAVYDWIFANSVGIKLVKPNYEEIYIKPLIDERLGFVEGGYETKYGKINVKWYFHDSSVIYEIEIPKNTTATVELIDKSTYKVGPGKYTFSRKIK